MPSFESGEMMRAKIVYQLRKIEQGSDAKELHNSVGCDLKELHRYMVQCASMNSRNRFPYKEFVLSSPVGEKLSDDKLSEIGKSYMEKMGYENAVYSLILNRDKDHHHVHIYTTTVNMDGSRIDTGQDFRRSYLVMRELEKKHGLEELKRRKNVDRIYNYIERRAEDYMVQNALGKAYRNKFTKDKIAEYIESCGIDISIPSTNKEIREKAGEVKYRELLEELSAGGFFNPILKETLIAYLDTAYNSSSKTMDDFRRRLDEMGIYMRVCIGRKYHIVYGMPEAGFYVRDTSLPKTYRIGELYLPDKNMDIGEQQKMLYSKVSDVLRSSIDYEDFISKLGKEGVGVRYHVSPRGFTDISYYLTDLENPIFFKSGELSTELSLKKIGEVLEISDYEERVIQDGLKTHEVEWNYGDTDGIVGGLKSVRNRNKMEEDDSEFEKQKKRKRRTKGMGLK